LVAPNFAIINPAAAAHSLPSAATADGEFSAQRTSLLQL
jgi:hypothetical protein